jgi:hypothetical protein
VIVEIVKAKEEVNKKVEEGKVIVIKKIEEIRGEVCEKV